MVRVAPDQEQLRTARISLASALGAAVLAVLVWAYMREPPPGPPAQRTLDTYPVQWVCEKNPEHHFTAEGRFESLPCRQCDGRCFIQLRYVCLRHNREFDALVQFEQTPSDDQSSADPLRERVVRYRYDTRSPWRPCDGRVPCAIPGCTGQTRRPHTSWSEHVKRAAGPSTPLPGSADGP